MIRIASRSTRVVVILAVFSALIVACSDDDATSDATNDPIDQQDSVDGSSVSAETPKGDSGSADVDPLGYRVIAAPGTELTVEVVPVYGDQEQQRLTQNVVVTEEPWGMLFTVFIDSATLTVSLDSGAEATIETIRGHLVDIDDPFGPIEVTEVLDTVSVTGPEPIVIDVP